MDNRDQEVLKTVIVPIIGAVNDALEEAGEEGLDKSRLLMTISMGMQAPQRVAEALLTSMKKLNLCTEHRGRVYALKQSLYIFTLDSHDCYGPFDGLNKAAAFGRAKGSPFQIMDNPPYPSTVVLSP